jgi:hypothetical protein
VWGIAGIIATVLVAWYFFSKGPSVEKQDEMLAVLRTNANPVHQRLDELQRALTNIVSVVNGLTFKQSLEFVAFSFGEHGIEYPFSPDDFKEGPVYPVPDVPFKIYVENGRFFCDVSFVPAPGLPPVKLQRNVISGKPSEWDINQSDRALEVVNDKLMPIIQLYYKDDAHIVFNGFIPFKGGVYVASAEGLRRVMQNDFSTKYTNGLASFDIKRLFKYPSFKHPGQFEEN